MIFHMLVDQSHREYMSAKEVFCSQHIIEGKEGEEKPYSWGVGNLLSSSLTIINLQN